MKVFLLSTNYDVWHSVEFGYQELIITIEYSIITKT